MTPRGSDAAPAEAFAQPFGEAAADPTPSAEPSAVEVPQGPGDPTPSPLAVDPGDRCPPRDAPKNAIVVCAEVQGERFVAHRLFPRTGGVVRPNRPLLVWVRHPEDMRLTMETEGDVGIHYARLRDPREAEGPASRGEADERDPASIRQVVTRRTLPPMMPPKFTVLLGLRGPDAEVELDRLRVDLLIEPTYRGAIRMGVATVGLGAVNANYSVGTPRGGGQTLIVAGEPDPFETELVVGYAPYFDSGGRPRSGCVYSPWCFAPYVGLGVLSPAEIGPQVLTSLHLGFEWEPVNGFSIAFTAVGRRVRRLGPDRRVGGPATPDEALTTEAMSMGAGIVFNMSPRVLALAANPTELQP